MNSTFDTQHTKTRRVLKLFDCIEAPCIEECPISQKVPQYMRAVSRGDDAAARRIVDEDNPLPCVLGRVCDHLCEHTCVRNHLDEPVAIRDVKRYISELEGASGSPPAERASDCKVAVIGAGPGGMAAAKELAAAGCDVDIFEQHRYAGGMVGGAVPEYRLPWSIFERDLRALEGLGVMVHFGRKAGRDFSLQQLREMGFGAIVIMVGAQLSKRLGLDNENCDGVTDALSFLRDAREGRNVAVGERVGVIGAGDTAMDCARVASRLGGADVSLIYRRTIDQMPADREEIEHLLEEDISVVEMSKPQKLVVEDGRLKGLVCRRMEYRGDHDASGRKVPHEVPGSDFEIPLDTLILAISQNAVLDFLNGEAIELNERGYIKADPETFRTSIEDIYAGGDVANEGPASIVKAAAAGKAIANAILQRRPADVRRNGADVDKASIMLRKSRREWRVPEPRLPLEYRGGFDEVVLTYDDEQAREEASRCLDCDLYCGICVGVCPNLALQSYESDAAEQRYQVAVIADLCNECGNCTTFCPSAGKPYLDKPRLFLDRNEFEAERDNAFMIFHDDRGWSMDARFGGETLQIDDSNTEESEPYATMRTLLRGIAGSVPDLPTADPGSAGK